MTTAFSSFGGVVNELMLWSWWNPNLKI